MLLWKELFENIVRKGENTGNNHFLLVLQCFLPYEKYYIFMFWVLFNPLLYSLLVTRIFSFSHNVFFNLFNTNFIFFCKSIFFFLQRLSIWTGQKFCCFLCKCQQSKSKTLVCVNELNKIDKETWEFYFRMEKHTNTHTWNNFDLFPNNIVLLFLSIKITSIISWIMYSRGLLQVILMIHNHGEPLSSEKFWPGHINSLPNNKCLDWSKLKAFTDDKINVTEKQNSVCEENIVGKGENTGYQHFLLFPQCFQKPSVSGSIKVRIVW